MALSPRIRRNLIILAAVAGLMVTCDVTWRLRHPAPLGRSQAEIQRNLSAGLPVGTSKDSVVRYLTGYGLNAFEGDSGRMVQTVFKKVVLPRPFPGNIFVTFTFDGENRLAKTEFYAPISAP